MFRCFFPVSAFFWAFVALPSFPAFGESPGGFSPAELDRIGRKIWQNECGGTVAGLTDWNYGENFASLGIGHFIWFPKGVQVPFEESFPPLKNWLKDHGVALPAWLREATYCPWPNRDAFLKDHESPKQKELRTLLSSTIREQTLFIIHRLEQAAPRFQAAAGPASEKVNRNMALLRQTAAGNFAMIDYVNFKGDGLNPKERYQGQGWGLLQVLMEMKTPANARAAPAAFAEAAKTVLARRVANSPPERGEKRWLKAWQNRVGEYGA
jgi:hypothetical protein